MPTPPLSLTPLVSVLPTVQSTFQPTIQPTGQPTIQPIPTLQTLGALVDPALNLTAGPVTIPLELQIPTLKVNASIIAVGLTLGNVMSTPQGPVDDPVWHTAFWYRGGGIPGDIGTATIAGHVNNPQSKPEIFAHIGDLHPGDLIIIHDVTSRIDIRFSVDQVKVYSFIDFSNPLVLVQVYGLGPVTGYGPLASSDGLSHLVLITCAGTFNKGHFDQRTVVFATRNK
jgi:hypothetical protein